METCTYEHCDNPAEFIDEMDDKVCSDCMVREINESSAEPESFERFCLVS